MMVVIVFEVSAPYCRTVLTIVLKILTLILVESCFEFHIFFNCRNEALALPILALTFASDPPCSSMMLSRYVKDSTFSRASPSSVIELVFAVLCLRISPFPLCILRPTDEKAAATLLVFIYICPCVWNRRARSSTKSKSSNLFRAIHPVPCFPSDVEVFIIQPTIRRKRKEKSRHPYLTLVLTCNVSVICSSCTTLQCIPSYEFRIMLTIFSGTP
ncbi:hypothetical protein MS3_00001237 [Schistosoma haematobium]|uniref:Uncharacterized protein n=1 Tax=Schistosoma haematobium TaxID=6185 RepID=A0A922S3S7_SCHHA|nr:hypothetical protein MS3_00001237 [Schistosoma haematobium]KAH9592085.1 hypothetical protein MS3_00001237 [Schistosoma haematobium]